MPASCFFFDIDGCLHPMSALQWDDQGRAIRRPGQDGLFQWLEVFHIIGQERPDIRWVCHSMWRTWYPLEALRRMLPPVFEHRLSGVTHPGLPRWRSIAAYVAQEKLSADRWVVLDDDPEAFPPHLPQLIAVDSERGLSDAGAHQALLAALRKLP